MINKESKHLKKCNNTWIIFYILIFLLFLLGWIKYFFESKQINGNNTIQGEFNKTKNF